MSDIIPGCRERTNFISSDVLMLIVNAHFIGVLN